MTRQIFHRCSTLWCWNLE